MSEPRVVFCECGAYTMGFDPATSGEDEQCVIVITAGGEIVHRARTWERTAAVLVMKMDDLDKALARISALEAENERLADSFRAIDVKLHAGILLRCDAGTVTQIANIVSAAINSIDAAQAEKEKPCQQKH